MASEEELVKESEKRQKTGGLLAGLSAFEKILFWTALIGGIIYYQYVSKSKMILVLAGAIILILLWKGRRPSAKYFTIGELRILGDRELQTMARIHQTWGATGQARLTGVDIPLYTQKSGETELTGWVIGVKVIDRGKIPRNAAIVMSRETGQRLAFKYLESELTGREEPFEIKRVLGSEIVDFLYGKRIAQEQYGQDFTKRG